MDFIYCSVVDVEKIEWLYPSWNPTSSTTWGISSCIIQIKNYSINGVDKPLYFLNVPSEIGMAILAAISNRKSWIALASLGIPSLDSNGSNYKTEFGGGFKISPIGQHLF